jgi:hypothetical protein
MHPVSLKHARGSCFLCPLVRCRSRVYKSLRTPCPRHVRQVQQRPVRVAPLPTSGQRGFLMVTSLTSETATPQSSSTPHADPLHQAWGTCRP